MEKLFTPTELFGYIQSYKYAFFCGENDGYSCLYVRLKTDNMVINTNPNRKYASIEGYVHSLKKEEWTEGGIFLAGTEFDCTIDEEDGAPTIIIRSDYMERPVKMTLYR